MARKKDRGQGFEDVSSYSSSKEYNKRKKNRKGRVALQSIAAFLCVLLILLGAGMIYVSTDLLGELTTNAITKDPAALGFHEEDQVVDDRIINIALFGLDSRNSEFRGQSDVNMILTVDNRHGSIKMTSILRDSSVHIEGDGYPEFGYIDWTTKLNAAYSVGGPELAIRTLNRSYSLRESPLRIEDYVAINFVNMASIIDAVNGVEMEVTAAEIEEINTNLRNLVWEVEQKKEEDMANGTYEERNYPIVLDTDYMHATADVATYQLNGNQAVSYGRIRNIGDDYGRVERQQKVLAGLISQIKKLSVMDYPNMVKKLMPYCETSLELDDIISMLPILGTDMSIETITVPDANFETDLHDVKYDLVYGLEGAAKRISTFIYEESSPFYNEFYGSTPAPEEGGE